MAIGFLAANGDPTLEIEIKGVGQAKKFTCLIDTGFTGFLSIPLLQALPLGLVLTATTTVTFANGITESRLICLGHAKVDSDEQLGTILLEYQSNQVMLGMDFLKKFGLKLLVCPTTGQIEVVPSGASFTVPAASPAQPASAAVDPTQALPAPALPPSPN